MDIAIVGYGAIGRLLHKLLADHAPDIRVVAVVVRDERRHSEEHHHSQSTQFVCRVDEIAAFKPAIVVECAGHEMLRVDGEQILAWGSDLLVSSVGALANPTIEESLRRGARFGNSVIRIPSGALGGLDVLGAARFAGLDSVVYTSRKAVQAWMGTPADKMLDLHNLHEAQAFYRSDARTAALTFPQNANVAAAVALAGAGFERTEVVLIADPHAIGNQHSIEASGPFGEIKVSVLGKTLATNPKTSVLAPYSLLRSLTNLTSNIVVA